jgi:hypothetical protein
MTSKNPHVVHLLNQFPGYFAPSNDNTIWRHVSGTDLAIPGLRTLSEDPSSSETKGWRNASTSSSLTGKCTGSVLLKHGNAGGMRCHLLNAVLGDRGGAEAACEVAASDDSCATAWHGQLRSDRWVGEEEAQRSQDNARSRVP